MKKLFVIIVLMALVMSGFAQQLHYHFSEVVESGQTLYFLKRDYAPQEVWVTYPCSRDYYANGNHIITYYYGFDKPVGDLVIPSTVTHNDTIYTVTRIDFSAFYECSDITSVVFPNTLTFIGQRAFLSCHGITGEVVIPDSVTIIGANAFFYCNGITSVVFGSGLQEIRDYSFAQCYALEHISNLPETLTVLDDGAFDRCGPLCDSIVIPPLVTTIGERAFAECHIPSVVISEGVTTIERGAFCSCPIGALHIPSTLVSISPENNAYGERAFHNCTRLQSITVDEANPIYDSRGNCNALIETATNTLLKGCKNTIIPDDIAIIGLNAFLSINELNTITIPNSVERLEASAFAGCNSLTTITLPSNISYIGIGALNCFGLTSIISKSPTPPTAYNSHWEYGYENSFMGVNRGIPIYIPVGTIDAYQNAEGWNYFTNFIEEEPIIYIDYEPDTCKFITSSPESDFMFDIDHDGTVDMTLSGYTQHGAVLVHIAMSNGFQLCRSNENTILNADTINWFHNDDLSNGFPLDSYRKRYGFRKTEDGHHFFGWMEIYWDGIFVPEGKMIYLDRMAFCTIPDYPLLWGQTSIESFLLDNTEWYYEIQNDDGSITYQHLKAEGDTTIHEKRPKIIIRSNTQYDRDEITEVTHEYIYEEDGIVYWWNKNLEEFTILYNLNADVGDEWEIKVGMESLTMHVDAVENYEYEDKFYRILSVSDENDLFSGNIVCGIGHLTSFFPEKLMNQDKGYRVEGLRCYWVNDELVFKYGDKDCDAVYTELHNGIDEDGPSTPSTDSGAFTVYPNPANGILTVSVRLPQCDSPTTGQTEYQISNLMGQTLLQGRISAETQQINISTLPSGMYFINVGKQTMKFVVK